jgi:hypothetical protein
MHYFDDYLFIGVKGSGDCSYLLQTFHKVCQHLGVPIAHEKTEGPVTEIVFLGLKIDTKKQTVTIPLEKLEEIVLKIKIVLKKSKVTLKQLQSLIGSLKFACRAVAPGRVGNGPKRSGEHMSLKELQKTILHSLNISLY